MSSHELVPTATPGSADGIPLPKVPEEWWPVVGVSIAKGDAGYRVEIIHNVESGVDHPYMEEREEAEEVAGCLIREKVREAVGDDVECVQSKEIK